MVLARLNQDKTRTTIENSEQDARSKRGERSQSLDDQGRWRKDENSTDGTTETCPPFLNSRTKSKTEQVNTLSSSFLTEL